MCVGGGRGEGGPDYYWTGEFVSSHWKTCHTYTQCHAYLCVYLLYIHAMSTCTYHEVIMSAWRITVVHVMTSVCLYVCVFLSVLPPPHSTANKFPTSLLTALTHTPPLSLLYTPSPLPPSLPPSLPSVPVHSYEYSILFIFGQFGIFVNCLIPTHTHTHAP